MAAIGSAPIKETVYNGPTHETVYSGDNANHASAPAGTVYDPAKHVPKKLNTSTARNAVTKTIRYASVRFFVIAAICVAEFFIYQGDESVMAYSALLTAVVFGLFGIFALRLSRGAFMAAMIWYGLDTLLLAIAALNTDFGIFFAAKPLIVHGVIIYRLYKNYELLGDLHDLENQ